MICRATSGANGKPRLASSCTTVVLTDPGPPETTKRFGLLTHTRRALAIHFRSGDTHNDVSRQTRIDWPPADGFAWGSLCVNIGTYSVQHFEECIMHRMLQWVALLFAVSAFAQDTSCPAYPAAARSAAEAALHRGSDFAQYHHLAARSGPKAVTAPPSNNFIDDAVFALMRRDNVVPAPLTTDAAFLRRVYLDLSGRIPTLGQAQSFLASPAPDRRARLIDALLASPAYTDQFSYWFLQCFQMIPTDGLMSDQERNHCYDFVRKFVATDSPYDAFVRSLLTATGDTDVEPAIAFFGRRFINNSPAQDAWDGFTDLSTTQLLIQDDGTVYVLAVNDQGQQVICRASPL